MKAKLTKITFLTYLLLTNFILFAKDDGGDILDDGNLENSGPTGPPDVAPINTQLIWLLILGIAFAYHLYKTKKVKA
ncbi:MAG: hypothetical protein ACOVKJ_00610 [Flavobacterium sp.]|jgi:hypothetical protein